MSLNVLVVDDSAVMRRMIRRTLELSGIPLGEVYEAGNGEGGLELLKVHWVDLVLLDLNMPVMDGEAMLSRLRADESLRGVKVVVISTEGSETRIQQLQPHIDGYIHKPFTPEALGAAIRTLTGVHDGAD